MSSTRLHEYWRLVILATTILLHDYAMRHYRRIRRRNYRIIADAIQFTHDIMPRRAVPLHFRQNTNISRFGDALKGYLRYSRSQLHVPVAFSAQTEAPQNGTSEKPLLLPLGDVSIGYC